ncbi:DUF1177 family protein [Haloferax volcanii]|uniref:DUF1177 family protein n=3 Tax=Haloferax volcanii TaxID=2246 RepID=D4GS97_HALVD|nr:DUF1177 family protein [Haloferax volcanii]ADE04926.1 DUF1177 family protein [Haloferax volcanii DS2]ELY35283.1 hypothetical protein C498_04181 [Haloferax volcanii DS2]MBS8120886.1 DUF1177 family protein [Haloferax volcanii]MBS8125923.1 DUF1177 family protein [Haloferax volcanii]MBS8129776.1 DUF1177 family protein [Haloferax volcanii]
MFDKIQQAYDILSRPDADGELVRDALETYGLETEVTTISTDEGATDFVKTVVPGRDPDAPTLGVVGRLGGVAARPAELGPVSDADGAIVALAVALHLGEMRERGDVLAGDVRIATHVCPDAPVVGVATTSVSPVPGCGTGANYLTDLLDATGFVVETAKDFTRGRASFYDEAEYDRLTSLYGSMGRLQTLGEGV